MTERSVWVLNEYGSPYAYRLPSGELVRIANAASLVLWHKRRVRAAKQEQQKGRDDET